MSVTERGTGDADFVVVANRLPVDLEKLPDGTATLEAQPRRPGHGARADAAQREGAWVGWPGVADADVEPFVEDGLTLHPVRLSARGGRGTTTRASPTARSGRSTTTSWPRRRSTGTGGTPTSRVNQRFAEAVAEVAAQGATVWMQDYQLQLRPGDAARAAPRPADRLLPAHPVPAQRAVHAAPVAHGDRRAGCSAPTSSASTPPGGAQNFLWLATPLSAGAQPRRRRRTHRSGVVRSATGRSASARSRSRSTRRGLDELLAQPPRCSSAPSRSAPTSATRRTDHPGVDRLDYTKGIDVRLRAFAGAARRRHASTRATSSMVQLATPSRERVEHYQQMRDDIEQSVGRINGEFARVGHPVVHYLHQSLPREELAAFFLAADVMLVTPLRDGMNLVAKEYVACRDDLGGALVLSEFAGAAAELRARSWSTRTTSTASRTRWTALTIDPAEGRGGCGRCAARSSPTTSTAGPARSSKRWARRPRSDSFPPLTCPIEKPRRGVDRRGPARGPAPSDRAVRAHPTSARRVRLRRHARPDRRRPRTRPAHCPSRSGALRSLAGLHETTTASSPAARCATSRRSSRLPAEVHLVGSHGSEFDVGFVHALDDDARDAAPHGWRPSWTRLVDGDAGRARWRSSPPASRCTSAGPTPTSGSRVLDAGPRRSVRLGRRPRHRGQGGRRAGRRPDRQGPRARHAAPPGRRDRRDASSATTSPTRRRSPGCPGPDVGVKVGDGETPRPVPGRRHRPTSRTVLAFLLEERRNWLYGDQAAADRAAHDARQRAVGRAGHAGRPAHLAVPPGAGLGRGVRRPARRPGGRPLLDQAGADGAAARPALPAGHDDRRDALVGPAGHRLPRPLRLRAPHRSGAVHLRQHPRRRRVRAAAGVRAGAGPADASSATACGCSARPTRWCCGRPASSGRSPPTACTTPHARSSGRPADAAGRAGAALRHQRPRRARGRPRWSGRAGRRVLDASGSTALTLPQVEKDLVARSALTLRGLVPQRDRRDHGRRHDVAARGDRRRPQLGLPLLLAAGRRDDREGAGLGRLDHRGGGRSSPGCTACSATLPGPELLHPLYTIAGHHAAAPRP